MAKTALITGITGQDGAYLAKLLLSKDYSVFGTFRQAPTTDLWRLLYLDIIDQVHLVPADMLETASLIEAIQLAQPDEVYHLAAQAYVGDSLELTLSTAETTALGVTRVLEAIRVINPKIKFYQASTNQLFGKADRKPQGEETPFHPANPYGVAKLYGYWMTSVYREMYGIFACNGVLYNHESPLGGLRFVTRKVANSVARIALGLDQELRLGSLEARRDWGYAPEYVESMWLMLQQESPMDYVIATGIQHSVRDLVQMSFDVVSLPWEKYVRVDEQFVRPPETQSLVGDASKAAEMLGWKAATRLPELVSTMVNEDLDRWTRWQRGERFAWDAPNSPDGDNNLSRR